MNDVKSKTKEYKCSQCEQKIIRYPSEIRSVNVFCSRTCSATFHNKKKIIIKKCPECHQSFHPTRGGRGIFCSSKCSTNNKRSQVYTNIENGQVDGHCPSTLRKYLIHKRGNVCEICKITEWQGIPLVVITDHINGNPYDNRLENLRLICSNCDANLPTYKAKNVGNGRTFRRKNGASRQT